MEVTDDRTAWARMAAVMRLFGYEVNTGDLGWQDKAMAFLSDVEEMKTRMDGLEK